MFEDIKRTVEAATKDLSAERAQRIARSLLEPGARKDQVSKLAGELMDWSQRNRERVASFVSREVKAQLQGMGLATKSDLEALARRVRSLENRGGVSKRSSAAKTTAGAGRSASKAAVRGRGAKTQTVRKTTAKLRSTGRRRGSSGS